MCLLNPMIGCDAIIFLWFSRGWGLVFPIENGPKWFCVLTSRFYGGSGSFTYCQTNKVIFCTCPRFWNPSPSFSVLLLNILLTVNFANRLISRSWLSNLWGTHVASIWVRGHFCFLLLVFGYVLANLKVWTFWNLICKIKKK